MARASGPCRCIPAIQAWSTITFRPSLAAWSWKTWPPAFWKNIICSFWRRRLLCSILISRKRKSRPALHRPRWERYTISYAARFTKLWNGNSWRRTRRCTPRCQRRKRKSEKSGMRRRCSVPQSYVRTNAWSCPSICPLPVPCESVNFWGWPGIVWIFHRKALLPERHPSL